MVRKVHLGRRSSQPARAGTGFCPRASTRTRAAAAVLIAAFCGCAGDDGEAPANGGAPSLAGDGGPHPDGTIPSSSEAGDPLGMHPGITMTPPTISNDGGRAPDAGVSPFADGGIPGSNNADAGPKDATANSDSGNGSTDATTGNDGGVSACSGGRTWPASDGSGAHARVTGYGVVQVNVPVSTHIVALQTTMVVPPKPTMAPTLYAWPGLEPWPGGQNLQPIGQGVLQPVLTWGTSCGTYAPKNPTGWWISPQYVNPYTSESAFYGCKGGKALDVQVGDTLDITMTLKGASWTQTVVDRESGQMSSFDIDLKAQAQNWALFEIEMPNRTKPVSDVVFTSTTLTFADPSADACQPSVRGSTDYFSAPESSADGTKCCYSKIILRAQGVPATSPNVP